MTKATVLCVVLIVSVVTFYILADDQQSKTRAALRQANAQVERYGGAIVKLDALIKTCASWSELPPGFVIDQGSQQPRWQELPLPNPAPEGPWTRYQQQADPPPE